jgi:hypothetical protein
MRQAGSSASNFSPAIWRRAPSRTIPQGIARPVRSGTPRALEPHGHVRNGDRPGAAARLNHDKALRRDIELAAREPKAPPAARRTDRPSGRRGPPGP